MLKDLDPILVPELLGSLAQMGHGDVLAVVDRNFPAHSCGNRVVELPGVDGTRALRAILGVLPVDTFQAPAAWHMLSDDGEAGPAAEEVQQLIDTAEGRQVGFGGVRRSDFYGQARQAYCTVRTGDERPYACFLLAKGVL